MKGKTSTSKSMKKYVGGGQNGPGDGKIIQEWYNPRNKDGAVGKTIEADTSGYAAGAKKFPIKVTTRGTSSSGTASRKQIDKMIKNPKMSSFGVKAENGGSVGKSKKK